jgi:hypothetical protein
MNNFTNEELDLLYDLARDKHDLVMRGDWQAVKDEISQLHLLMYKILEFKPQIPKESETKKWFTLIEVCKYFKKHPISFGKILKQLRDSDRLIYNIHYFRTGEHKCSKILWNIEELTKFFVLNHILEVKPT